MFLSIGIIQFDICRIIRLHFSFNHDIEAIRFFFGNFHCRNIARGFYRIFFITMKDVV